MFCYVTKLIKLHGAKLAEELEQFSRDGYELVTITPVADPGGRTVSLLIVVRKLVE
jgi:hypothetical protein